MITLTMVDQGRSDFYIVLTMSLRALESKQMLISLLFKVIHFLKLGTQNLGSYMGLTCEYELDILSNTKGSLAKDHSENNMKLRPFLTRHLLHNRLFLFFENFRISAPLQ